MLLQTQINMVDIYMVPIHAVKYTVGNCKKGLLDRITPQWKAVHESTLNHS